MKSSDVTPYVFDVTIGMFILFGMITADVMQLFGGRYSGYARLSDAGLSDVKAGVIVFVVYLAVYSIVSRLIWMVLRWFVRLIIR